MLNLVPSHADASAAAYADGDHAELLASRCVVPGEGVTGWTLVNRQPFYNADPKLDLPPALAAHGADFRTLAACPVIHENELHGVVTLYSTTLNEYVTEHQRLLETAVKLLATTLAAISRRPHVTLQTEPALSVPAPNMMEVVLKSELMH